MGIDYGGGMIVGNHGSQIDCPEDVDCMHEWLCEDNGMQDMSEHYDADYCATYFGYEVKNIDVGKIDEKWVEEVKRLGEQFTAVTGVKAKLIGTQNIW